MSKELPDFTVGKNAIVENPGGLGHRIESIWAFVSINPDDDEGICAMHHDGSWIPLVTADEGHIKDLTELAKHMTTATDVPIKLVRFTVREDIGLAAEL